MIKSTVRITFYVNDQKSAKAFWTEKMGFVVRLEQQMGPDVTWLELSPEKDSETIFVIYDKALMQEHNPEINVGTPSVILSTDHVDSAYKNMKEKGVEVGEIMKMPYGCMFHFTDMDGNVFLVKEEI